MMETQPKTPGAILALRILNILSVLFILIGGILTLENFGYIHGISRHWPLFVILLGLIFILLFLGRKRVDAVLVWLGVFFFILGVFFYILNFHSWRDLAYLWPVFLGIIGVSFFVTDIFIRKPVYIYLALVFVAMFFALYLVFTVSFRLWPASLVVFGLSLGIISRLGKRQ